MAAVLYLGFAGESSGTTQEGQFAIGLVSPIYAAHIFSFGVAEHRSNHKRHILAGTAHFKPLLDQIGRAGRPVPVDGIQI